MIQLFLTSKKGNLNINAVDKQNRTVLFRAVSYPNLIKLLIDAGIDKNIVDKEGRTANEYAKYCLKYGINMYKKVRREKYLSKEQIENIRKQYSDNEVTMMNMLREIVKTIQLLSA